MEHGAATVGEKTKLDWILNAAANEFQNFELLSGNEDLSVYRFNTGTARHTFCSHCGVHPFYVPRSDPDKIDVNARCIDVIDLSALRPKSFDGRNWEAAMQAHVPWR